MSASSAVRGQCNMTLCYDPVTYRFYRNGFMIGSCCDKERHVAATLVALTTRPHREEVIVRRVL